MCLYLVHFERPLAHAQHYLGWTQCDLDERITRHRGGDGARLLAVANERGIGWEVVRVWPGAKRSVEQKYKRAKHNRRLCPVCRQEQITRGRASQNAQGA